MFIKLQQRGTLTLPRAVRAGLDDNTMLEVVRRPDGVIELRPQQLIDAAQAWFWTERWQRMEREADEDVAAGRMKSYDGADSLLAALEADSSADPSEKA